MSKFFTHYGVLAMELTERSYDRPLKTRDFETREERQKTTYYPTSFMKPQRHNYEQLDVYNRSLAVAVQIIENIDQVRPYRLAEQISSSSVSIPSNIAEGAERGSNKEFHRFLEFSSGSASELVTQLTILKLSNRLPAVDLDAIIKETKEINSMIRGLMNSLE